MNRKECNFINSVSEGAEIVRLVDHPNIRLLADFYHMAREGESAQAIADAGELLYHCHIAEKDKRTPPGVAKDDFRPYFEALKQINYQGAVSIECGWSNFKQQLPEAIDNMQEQLFSINL